MFIQTCNIEDCYYEGFNGTEKWYNNIAHDSEVVVNYDSENAVHNDRLRMAFFEKVFNPQGDWILSFDTKGTTKYNAGARWGIKGTSTTSPERSCCSIEIENYNTYIDFANSNTSAIGNTLTVYRNGSLIRTMTADWLNDELTLYIQQWVNYIDFYWKNIKIKAL